MSDFEKVYSIKFDTRSAQAALKRIDKNLVGISRETRTVDASFKAFVAKGAVSSVDRLNGRLKATRVNITQLRTGVNTVSRTLTRLSMAFAGVGGVAVHNSLELNKAMGNVETLLSGGTDQVIKFKGEVQKLSMDTGKSTGELAEGLYQVVSALGEGAENTAQLTQAARAGVAGRADTASSILLLSAATKAYGDTSADAMGKVSDLAFQTVKLGVTTFPELAASMGKVLPLASSMKTRQEELWGAMATLTGVTGDTAEVTTQLSSVYSAFMKPSDDLTKLAKEQGFASASTMLKSKGLAETIKILAKETGGEADAIARLIPRKEGQLALLALTGKQAENYTKKTKEMESAAGSTDEAFRKQTEGINKQGHEWEKTKQRMVVFSQRLGDKLLPVLERILDRLEPYIKYLEDMDEETIDAWLATGKWVTILAVATKALGGMLAVVQGLGTLRNLTTGINTLSGGLSTVTANANTATGAMGGLLGKISALVAAAGAGYTIGSMLQEIFIEPHNKRVEKQREGLEGVGDKARAAAKIGTLEEKQKALEELKREQDRLDTSDITSEDVAGALIHTFNPWSDGDSPAERRKRIKEDAASGIKELEGSVRKEELLAGLKSKPEIYNVSQQSSGGTSVTIGDTNVTIQSSGDPEKLQRELNRMLDERDRKSRKAIERAARGEAPAEF